MNTRERDYLLPYIRAMRVHGTRFPSLLWRSRASQAARFGALTRLYDFRGRTVLDAGCGQADLARYLAAHGMEPARYIGVEALGEHLAVARRRSIGSAVFVEGDFVADPSLLSVGADVVVFCGSLNTLDRPTFRRVLAAAAAAAPAVLFNFLSSSHLAAADWLTWHEVGDVLDLGRSVGRRVRTLNDYLPGDCAMLWTAREARGPDAPAGLFA